MKRTAYTLFVMLMCITARGQKTGYDPGYNTITWQEKEPGMRYQPYYRSISPVKKTEKNYSLKDDQFYSGFTIYGNLNIALPMGRFMNGDLTSPGYGFNLGFNWQPVSKMPVSIGLESGFILLATNRQEYDLNIPITSSGTTVDYFTIPLEFQVNSKMYPVYPVIRVWTPTPYVQLYAEAIAGLHIFSTDSRLKDLSSNHILSSVDDRVIVRENNSLSATYAAGAGLGLNITITDFLNLYMNVRYLAGGKTRYYNQESIKNWQIDFTGSSTDPSAVDPDDLSYTPPQRYETETSTLQCNLGITIRIQ